MVGALDVTRAKDPAEARTFTRAILEDVRALELMLDTDLIERGVLRVGVEQEMFLVDEVGRPAAVAAELLEGLDDPTLTTELARFNLEANLPPITLDGDFLAKMRRRLEGMLAKIDAAAAPLGASSLLTGILPSLRLADMVEANMTPQRRYRLLNEALLDARGGSFRISIYGLDELELTADSVMIESANTSLQLHLQVDPEAFAPLYNLAQLISAPLLAASCNSPLLFGRRLWRETRVALFERSVDSRSDSQLARGGRSRVSFGDAWLEGSVLEVFREDVARFSALLVRSFEPDPVAIVERGEVPELSALTLHNSTVWRWNRACYGADGDRAHLRIENRVLPSGPTMADEIANAALFYGMMLEYADACADIPKRLPFLRAKENFVAAARLGLDAQLDWLDGRRTGARALLLDHLLPAARRGLAKVGVSADEIDQHIGIVEARVLGGQTGAAWLLDAYEHRLGDRSSEGCAQAVTRTLLRLQREGAPVHTWPRFSDEPRLPSRVAEIMRTDLFTVGPEDVIDLASSVMRWKRVRQVPVETDDGRLVGLVTIRHLLQPRDPTGTMAVHELMDRAPSTVAPDTPLGEAIDALIRSETGCLLVVAADRLVGIVTERDFVRVAASVLE